MLCNNLQILIQASQIQRCIFSVYLTAGYIRLIIPFISFHRITCRNQILREATINKKACSAVEEIDLSTSYSSVKEINLMPFSSRKSLSM